MEQYKKEGTVSNEFEKKFADTVQKISKGLNSFSNTQVGKSTEIGTEVGYVYVTPDVNNGINVSIQTSPEDYNQSDYNQFFSEKFTPDQISQVVFKVSLGMGEANKLFQVFESEQK